MIVLFILLGKNENKISGFFFEIYARFSCHLTLHPWSKTSQLKYVFPRLTTGFMFSRAWQQVTCFPALGTGCMFSRAWHRLHVFPRLTQVACFPALGTGFMFSRAWHRLLVFPRLAQVSCFHALGTGSMGCFPLCQTDRSEISGNTWGKWNDIFRLNWATNRNGCCYFKFFYRIPKLGQRTSLS